MDEQHVGATSSPSLNQTFFYERFHISHNVIVWYVRIASAEVQVYFVFWLETEFGP